MWEGHTSRRQPALMAADSTLAASSRTVSGSCSGSPPTCTTVCTCSKATSRRPSSSIAPTATLQPRPRNAAASSSVATSASSHTRSSPPLRRSARTAARPAADCACVTMTGIGGKATRAAGGSIGSPARLTAACVDTQMGNAMDLDLTADQVAFRDEVCGWLARNVPAEPLDTSGTAESFQAHRAWERKLYEAGYAAISWPAEYGGRDADLLTQAIFSEEYTRAGAPARVNVLGLGLAGPTIMAFGTPEQKARWLPRILSAQDIWCQGFSEPDAGSDLAGIKTSAVLRDDAYIVNGQKIWTSAGRFGDWIFTLVRSHRGAAAASSKHGGMTFLMIDMRSDGIEVRPIVQINVEPGFAEVFFTDVSVPAVNVIGQPGDGWRIAMAALGFERATGLGSHVRFSADLAELVAIVKASGRSDDPVVRDEVARLYTETEVFRHNTYRTLTRLAAGKPIGPEASVTKLYWSEMESRIFAAGMGALGAYAELTPAAGAARGRYGTVAGWES